MPSDRVTLYCPLCGLGIEVPFSLAPRVTFARGNGRKGFLTADVAIGGVEHTCERVARRANALGGGG